MDGLIEEPGDWNYGGGGGNDGLNYGGYSSNLERTLYPLESIPRDDFEPPPFVPTKEVLRMREMPRYGFVHNFSALLGYSSNQAVAAASNQSSNDIQKDYLYGLAVGSIIILIVFVVWCLVLILLKCLGKRRVGCAAGVPRKPPSKPIIVQPMGSQGQEVRLRDIELDEKDGFNSEVNASGGASAASSGAAQDPAPPPDDGAAAEYVKAMGQYDRQMKRFTRSILLTRIGFLIAGFFVIVASVLFYVMGIGSLIGSLNDVQGTLTYSDEVLNQSITIADAYVASSSVLRESRDEFQADVATFCPTLSLPPGNGQAEIKELLEGVLDGLNGFGASLESTASGMGDDLAAVQTSVNSVNTALDDAYPFLYAALGVAVIVIIITICLMVSVVMAWKRRKARNCFVRCMKNGIILPIFIIFMLLAWLFATLFLFIAIGGSDYCVTPDQNTVAALDLIQRSQPNEKDGDTLIFDILKYYVSGCNANILPKPEALEEEFTFLETVVGGIHNFTVFMSSDVALVAIQSLCSAEGTAFTSLNTTGALLHDRLHIVWKAFISLYEILSCKTMNPLYAGIAQEAMCVNGINGLVWIFSTQLAIAVCCMIMVTLRAAAQEIEEEVETNNYEDGAVAQNILVPSTFAESTFQYDKSEESPYVDEAQSGGQAEIGVEKAAETEGGAGYEKSWLS